MITATYTIIAHSYRIRSIMGEWAAAIGASSVSLDYMATGRNTCIITTQETIETSLQPLITAFEQADEPYIICQKTSDGKETWRQGGRIDSALASAARKYQDGLL